MKYLDYKTYSSISIMYIIIFLKFIEIAIKNGCAVLR